MSTFGADLVACAGLVERGDADRFLAAMAAPPAAREILFPLYAFNVEVARAPWVTQEPMIAEMRLQWWRDALAEIADGATVRRHEVVTPLDGVLSPEMARDLDELVAARRWDIYKDPFEDAAHFARYIDQTSGTLMWTAARLLGQTDENPVRDFAFAAGVASFLKAIPALERAGRIPLLDGTPEGVQALASEALQRLAAGRAQHGRITASARPALLPAWQAGRVLRQARAHPQRVADGMLGQSAARSRLSLMWKSTIGRV